MSSSSRSPMIVALRSVSHAIELQQASERARVSQQRRMNSRRSVAHIRRENLLVAHTQGLLERASHLLDLIKVRCRSHGLRERMCVIRARVRACCCVRRRRRSESDRSAEAETRSESYDRRRGCTRKPSTSLVPSLRAARFSRSLSYLRSFIRSLALSFSLSIKHGLARVPHHGRLQAKPHA